MPTYIVHPGTGTILDADDDVYIINASTNIEEDDLITCARSVGTPYRRILQPGVALESCKFIAAPNAYSASRDVIELRFSDASWVAHEVDDPAGMAALIYDLFHNMPIPNMY